MPSYIANYKGKQLETIVVGTEQDGKRELFFKLLFGNNRGLVCIAFKARSENKLTEHFYVYPEELPLIINEINENLISLDVYFCPHLFRERKRRKEFVEQTPSVWADLDFCPPENLLVTPSIVLETSPGKYQGFWVLNGDVEPDDAENISQRIAYKHAEEGADRSGWDLTQLLRVPFTYNHKYPETTIVKPISATRDKFSFEDFEEHYPAVSDYIRVVVNDPTLDPHDTRSAEDLLQERRNLINPMVWKLFTETPEDGKWSQDLWHLMCLLQEAGFTREETYVISRESACNKYARDGRPDRQLWKDVCRAEYKVTVLGAPPDEGEIRELELLIEVERKALAEAPPTFIERFIEWASSLGDAAVQYHQAGALVALSSIMCGSVRLATSFGTIVPNLWFMLLADTTLTRKTTAMDIAMELIEEIDEDVVLATDGSIEGLLTTLSFRPNQPSIFLRDEFSGLLQQMTHKDYMSGMAELFTKMYDGKMQKRILRKETIEVRDPRLIMYTGGIRSAVTSLLSYDHISSGFVPRFIFITAESDVSKVKPVGPPSEANLVAKEKIKLELLRLYEFYNTNIDIVIGDDPDSIITQKKFFDAELTPEAWLRYNELETTLTSFGVKHRNKDIMTPVADRLSKSILKSAILIAASYDLSDKIIVTELDIIRAASYGEAWFTHVRHVIADIGMGFNERTLERILNELRTRPQGLSRSQIMQNLRLTAKDYGNNMETLEQRGQISRAKQGRTEQVRLTPQGSVKSI